MYALMLPMLLLTVGTILSEGHVLHRIVRFALLAFGSIHMKIQERENNESPQSEWTSAHR